MSVWRPPYSGQTSPFAFSVANDLALCFGPTWPRIFLSRGWSLSARRLWSGESSALNKLRRQSLLRHLFCELSSLSPFYLCTGPGSLHPFLPHLCFGVPRHCLDLDLPRPLVPLPPPNPTFFLHYSPLGKAAPLYRWFLASSRPDLSLRWGTLEPLADRLRGLRLWKDLLMEHLIVLWDMRLLFDK